MQDESSAHSQYSSEKAGFKDHVISRRGLTGSGGIGRSLIVCRPIVPGKHKSGEIDLVYELEEALQCCGPRIERSRPWFYDCDLFETARKPLNELPLLA